MGSLFSLKNCDYIIGIDPDCDKSGLAFLNTKTKEVTLHSMTFPLLIGEMILFQAKCEFLKESFVCIVEAGWLNKSNWHTNKHQTHGVSAMIGNKTGRNHETGRKLIEMLRHNGIECLEVKPLKKGWNGPEGKITQEEISYFIEGIAKRTNQEARDAALIAWNFAGLPIKINFRKK